MRDGMVLSKVKATIICLWFLSSLSLGVYLFLEEVLEPQFMNSEVSLIGALRSSVGAALAANALFYVRRLYKDVFEQGLRNSKEPPNAREFATVVYFISRPFFASLFALIVVVTGVAFIAASTMGGSKLSSGFVLFSALLSAYGAATTGDVIRHLEKTASEKLRTFGGNL